MLLLVDNSKDLSTAQMTPRLLEYLVGHPLQLPVVVASSLTEVQRCLRLYRPWGAILSGGPLLLAERTNVGSYSQNITVLLQMERRRRPVLGICFGMQVMAAAYGGRVAGMRRKREGRELVRREPAARSHLWPPGPAAWPMAVSHRDHVERVPPGFTVTSRYSDGTIQSMEDRRHHKYGVQFHPEGSQHGHILLDRFLTVCATLRPCPRPLPDAHDDDDDT